MSVASSFHEANGNPERLNLKADSPCRIWVEAGEPFSTTRMSPIKHDYNRHPRMQISALAELAEDLYKTGQCRFIRPGTTLTSAFDHNGQAPDGRTIQDVFRRIEEPGSWVALYNVETDPRYRDFLNEVVAGVKTLVEPDEGPIYSVGGFIFISAPPSVTPFHIDRENNFWLQIHGRKLMTVWDHRDRLAVPQPAVENFLVHGGLDAPPPNAATIARGKVFDCGPGDGVYFPSTSPHATRSDPDWTRPGDRVSVSMGVVFYTERMRRIANMHAGNKLLRRLGLKPQEPGGSAMHDALSYSCGRGIISFNKRFRGVKPKPGF